MKHPFEILAYDPRWKEMYESEKIELINVFGDNLNSIFHIGSTAISLTKGKAEIDILVVVKARLETLSL